MHHFTLLLLSCLIFHGKSFKIIGNVTCSETCNVPYDSNLYIRIDYGSSWERQYIGTASFPSPFTYEVRDMNNGTVSATIEGRNGNLEFYTVVPVLVSSSNGAIANVIIDVKRCEPIKCKCPYGFLKDKNGCNVCKCIDPCHPLTQKTPVCPKELECFVHKEHKWFSGVQFIPHCLPRRKKSKKPIKMGSSCKTIQCKCPYGFLMDKDGCDVCKCYDPCRVPSTGKKILCSKDQKCFVDQKCDIFKVCKYEARCETEEENKRYNLLKGFKVEGNVISSEKCKYPVDDSNLYIIIKDVDGGQHQKTYSWATSFPARFSVEPWNIVNGTISAEIIGKSGEVQFVTDNPVPFSAMNGKTATVTIVIRANGTDNSTIEACKICPPIKCAKRCKYGLEKKDGCHICECQDPCNEKNGKAKACPKGHRCSVGTMCDPQCKPAPFCSLKVDTSEDSTETNKTDIEGGYPRLMQLITYQLEDMDDVRLNNDSELNLAHEIYIRNQSSENGGKLDTYIDDCTKDVLKKMGISSNVLQYSFDNANEEELEEFARNDPWVKAGVIKRWEINLQMITVDACSAVQFDENGNVVIQFG